MIDNLLGRPSTSWKRTQVFLVLIFWLWRITRTDRPPPFFALRPLNRALQRFTPWQIILTTLTTMYAFRNLDKILGLGPSEPLASLYSRSYYRATWINNGLDAGFATAMTLRPKWLRDICAPLFSIYYIIYANEADERLRRYRAVPTVELLRTTWEKNSNPYIRPWLHLPWLPVQRKVLLARPTGSHYRRPITVHLYFALPEKELSQATDLVFDVPGGGFVAMSPENHEERLRAWAIKTRRPVLSLDYGKAPEYPYPFAIDEAFDLYRLLTESKGQVIGMSGRKLNVIMSGDSAGAMIAVNVIIKILELGNPSHPSNPVPPHPLPVSLVLVYPCLDFNLTSWMTPNNLRVLRSEHSSGRLEELVHTKDHLSHVSPLSMADDSDLRNSRNRSVFLNRQLSWRDTVMSLANGSPSQRLHGARRRTPLKMRHSTSSVLRPSTSLMPKVTRSLTMSRSISNAGTLADTEGNDSDDEDEDADFTLLREQDRPIEARVKYVYPSPPQSTPEHQEPLEPDHEPVGRKIGTRLTMTSRTGYFLDRIIPPTMMRAMAILYIGPHRNPDFGTDYHISPILAPGHLLAQFPPLYMQCGEKDPFVDDTVVFAGKVREAKRARRVELDLALRADVNVRVQRLAMMKQERDRLAMESESDWVQMVLFSDWSHGYLQMPALMGEARGVIEELGEWIGDAFERQDAVPPRAAAVVVVSSPKKGSLSPQRKTGVAMSPFTSETETDDALTFVPRKSRSRSGDHTDHADFSPGARARTYSPGSEATVRDDSQDTAFRAPGDSSHLMATKVGSGVEASPSRAGTPGNRGGQKISETELMRRRRLLDSHIFE